MSVGREKEDFDKSGEPCKVIDCVINPETMKRVKEDG